MHVSLALGATEIEDDCPRKSVGCERTFQTESDKSFLFLKLEEIAEDLAEEMSSGSLCGRCIHLKYKTDEFQVRTKSKTLNKYIYNFDDIFHYASQMLQEELPLKLRLMGIRMTTLENINDVNSKGIRKFFKPVWSCKDVIDLSMVPDEVIKNSPEEILICSSIETVDEKVPIIEIIDDAPIRKKRSLKSYFKAK
ncbi:lesion bypass DNA polymerase [Rozella allomycis CSF55]|uniref:DNA-directed DNA polymerase n=1 Tax=Rozella allomycis (strain CSF55) TaxID=988480 RepID=A0A4P9Y9R1_ROZAC|nr:lesion bypass DNA polymerase [Rozella allomycis CSF55]